MGSPSIQTGRPWKNGQFQSETLYISLYKRTPPQFVMPKSKVALKTTRVVSNDRCFECMPGHSPHPERTLMLSAVWYFYPWQFTKWHQLHGRGRIAFCLSVSIYKEWNIYNSTKVSLLHAPGCKEIHSSVHVKTDGLEHIEESELREEWRQCLHPGSLA